MLIKNVKIVNYDKTIKNCDIEIESNKIKQIIKKKGIGRQTLIPGFIDLHTHGAMGKDVMNGKKSIEEISKHIVQFGTTSFMPTLMTAPKHKILNSLNDASKAKSVGSKILGLHIEGPWISVEKKGAHIEELIYSPTIQDVKNYQSAAKGKLKRIDFAPEVCSNEIIQEIINQGIIPVVGHTNATYEVANDAYEKGAKSVTHLWNGMSGITGRVPGVILASLNNPKCMPEIICDFIHINPEIIKFSIDKVGVERIIAITDSIKPAGMPDGKYISGGQDVLKKGLSINVIEHGSLAGGASMMFDQFKNLLSLNYSLQDVVRMTSYNAALNHNLHNEIGYIKKDMVADFVILNNKLNEIENVYIDGKEKYKKHN